MDEENRVEDTTVLTAPPDSVPEVAVPNATPVSSIARKEIMDGITTQLSLDLPSGF